MIDRLEATVKRYEEITNELSKPEIVQDIKKMTELSREQTRLTETVELYTKYKQVLSGIEEAKALGKDAELGEFAKEELSNLEVEKVEIEGKLEVLL